MRAPWARIFDDGLDLLVVVYALFTVCCHVTVVLSGNGYALWGLSAGVLVCTLGLVFRFRACLLRWVSPTPPREATTPRAPRNTLREWVARAAALVAAIVIMRHYAAHRDPWLLWHSAVAFALLSSLWVLEHPPAGPDAAAEGAAEDEFGLARVLGLFGLCLVGASATACMRLPNSDDVLYVSLANSVADHPALPLYVTDTIHHADIRPIPPYRVHSFELFAGTVAALTGIPAVYVMHLGLATLAGALLPVAWARLFRRLDADRWPWMVTVVVAWFLIDGSSVRNLSMQAFARLFQGKAILGSAMVPLIAAYAIEFARAPSRRRFVMLCAGQIAGIGLSSTGLWLAPLTAGLGLCVPLVARWRSLRTVGLGALSFVYPVALGLWVRALLAARAAAHSTSASSGGSASASLLGPAQPDFGRILDAIHNVFFVSFGSRPLVYVYVACLFFAWPLARTRLARRYLLAFGTCVVVVLLNPHLFYLITRNVTGNSTYARVLWVMPFPAAVAVCATWFIPGRGRPWARAIGVLLMCGLVAGFARDYPKKTALRAANLGAPMRLKVTPSLFHVARALRSAVGEAPVIAPRGVVLQLALLDKHPFPLMTKPRYWPSGDPDRAHRVALHNAILGNPHPVTGSRRGFVLHGLKKYRIRAIALGRRAWRTPRLATLLKRMRYEQTRTVSGHRLWVRDRWPDRF